MTPLQIDWHSAENHLAVNPLQPDGTAGLADFLTAQGLSHLCLFQTSGSEGLPKWVALPKEAFLISGRAVNEHFEVTAQDHWLIALPLHHVGGFSILARAHLSGSRYTQAQGRWQPAEFTAMCWENGITLASLVPTQVHDLVQARLTCPDPLRAVIVGGGGMSQALADAAVELGWRVFQSYGMTEAASQIATQPYNPFGAVFDVKSLQVLPHWRLHTDAEGVLTVSGPALARGYVTRATSGSWTWRPMPEEGLKTRDHVRLWTHGTRSFLQFVGRESGFLKILGELIHLAPLQEQMENLARQLGWSRLPVLLAQPDPRAETRLVLVCEAGSGDPAPLLARFHEASPPWLRVSEAIRLDHIPRSDLGKVQMEELRELVLR
ncbi:O-succinylbenzoic acid--CoA ligase [Prosthecobacter debontii]|uniref:O-succinylbenzoic acid--CoA ligase n=1 Tax=Prosthecobacter debontii TaxID=48467 RepID=A0A1T4XIM3_9BACT|nr:AMP-binding protein [Prosthecobacter debontii]SKA89263.1 O-succinylbenzoic acid--CoA ligase [Prosthecobacter debontii]